MMFQTGCEPMAAAPIVDDPVQGARLSVEVSLDGGTSWTRLTDQAFVQVRLTALPGFPSPPQHCTHMPCVLRCRTLPMPARCEISNAAALSQYSSQSNDNPRSAAYAAMAMVSADAPTMAYNSASAELRATTFCCLQ